jgi:16S rRNA (cytidine1402-2'-O)-methyltransferase
MGTLYLVATPIGNLEDLSLRARRVLGEVALVAAEDTRRTRQLLHHCGLKTRLISYWEHNKLSRLNEILARLESGDVALVSDAGTPNLSDPGYELVRAVLAAGHAVTPIPGPSAILAALAASGLPTDAFVYLGFLPRKLAERRQLLASVAAEPRTLVAFESPHRLLAALADMEAALGDRPAAVARELTKLHEEIFRGPLSAARTHFAAKDILGEITLVLAGSALQAAAVWSPAQVQAAVVRRVAGGERLKEAARATAAQAGWTARAVYDLAVRPSETGAYPDMPDELPA